MSESKKDNNVNLQQLGYGEKKKPELEAASKSARQGVHISGYQTSLKSPLQKHLITKMRDKEALIDSLRKIYERAVREKSGVSYLLNEDEQALITEDDIQKLRYETGYSNL